MLQVIESSEEEITTLRLTGAVGLSSEDEPNHVKQEIEVNLIIDEESGFIRLLVPKLELELEMQVESVELYAEEQSKFLAQILKVHGITEDKYSIKVVVIIKAKEFFSHIREEPDPYDTMVEDGLRKMNANIENQCWYNDNKKHHTQFLENAKMIENVNVNKSKFELNIGGSRAQRTKMLLKGRSALTNLNRLGWLTYDAVSANRRHFTKTSLNVMSSGYPVSYWSGKTYGYNGVFGSNLIWFLRNWRIFNYEPKLFTLLKKLFKVGDIKGQKLFNDSVQHFNRIEFEEQNGVTDFIREQIIEVVTEYFNNCLISGIKGMFWNMVSTIKEGFLKLGKKAIETISSFTESMMEFLKDVGEQVYLVLAYIAAQIVLLPAIISSAYVFLGAQFSAGFDILLEVLTEGKDVCGMDSIKNWFNDKFNSKDHLVLQGRDEEGFLAGMISLACSMINIHVEETHCKQICNFFSKNRFAGSVVNILTKHTYNVCLSIAYVVTKDPKYLIQDNMKAAVELMDRAATIFNDPQVATNMFSNVRTIEEIQVLYKDMEREWLFLSCCKDIEPIVRQTFLRTFENVKRANNQIYANAVVYTGRKMPAWIYLTGEPGQGKTNSVQGILAAVHARMRQRYPNEPSYKDKFSHAHIYSKPKTSDYFDMYQNQWVMMIDELFASSDPQMKAQESMLLTSLINDGTCPLDQAAVDNKGNSYMSSEIVVTTTNIVNLNNVLLTCPAAVARRLSFPLMVTKEEILKDDLSNLDNAWKFSLITSIGSIATTPYLGLLDKARIRTQHETGKTDNLYCRFYDVVNALEEYLCEMHAEPSLGSNLMMKDWTSGEPRDYEPQGFLDGLCRQTATLGAVFSQVLFEDYSWIDQLREIKEWSLSFNNYTHEMVEKYVCEMDYAERGKEIGELHYYMERFKDGKTPVLLHSRGKDSRPNMLLTLIFAMERGCMESLVPYIKEVYNEFESTAFDITVDNLLRTISRWFGKVTQFAYPGDLLGNEKFHHHVLERIIGLYTSRAQDLVFNYVQLTPDEQLQKNEAVREWYLEMLGDKIVMAHWNDEEMKMFDQDDSSCWKEAESVEIKKVCKMLGCHLIGYAADLAVPLAQFITNKDPGEMLLYYKGDKCNSTFYVLLGHYIMAYEKKDPTLSWNTSRPIVKRIFGYDAFYVLKRLAVALLVLVTTLGVVLLLVYQMFPALTRAVLPAALAPVVDEAWDKAQELPFCEQSLHRGNMAKPGKLAYRSTHGVRSYEVQGEDIDRISIFSRNMVFIGVETAKSIFHTPAVWLTTGQLVTVRHCTLGEPVTSITLYTSDGNNGAKINCRDFKTYEPPERDILLIRFRPNIVNPVKSLRRRLIPKDISVDKIKDIKKVGRLEQRTDGSLFCTKYVRGETVFFDSTTPYHSTKLDLLWKGVYILQDGQGESGDCGFPIIGGSEKSMPDVAFPFIGLHQGRLNNDSVVAPVWKEDLLGEKEMKELFGTPCVDYALGDRPYCNIEYDAQCRTFPGLFNRGKIEQNYFTPTKSAYRRTILEPTKEFPIMVRPAPLAPYIDEEGMARRPLYDNLKFHRTLDYTQDYHTEYLTKLTQLEGLWRGFGGDLHIMAKRLPGVLEAVLGMKAWGIQPLDDSTSVGPCTPFKTRKEAFCTADGYVNPELVRVVNVMIEQARKGKVNLLVDILTVKDELMEEYHKSRVFFNNDLFGMILCKIVLGDLVAKLKMHWAKTFGAVGVNPHGLGWKVIWNKINKFVGGIVGGDFSGFDASLKRFFLRLFFLFCNEFYGYEEGTPEWKELWSVIQMTFSAHYIFGNKVFTSIGSNTSGNWITSFINSFVSFTIFKIIFIVLRDDSSLIFEECFSGYFYGDDNIGGVREDCRHFFNNKTIAKAAKEIFGMTYTGPTKGDVTEEFLSRDEIVFLGRGFDEQGDFVFAPLRHTALNGMLFWSRDKVDEYEIFNTNIGVIARECSHYSEDVYNKYMKFVKNQCDILDYPMPQVGSYKYWRTRIQTAYHENDMPGLLLLEL